MAKKRPNILITISDDQPYYDIGGLGNDEIRTPAQERLMERGSCFDRAYHGGSSTEAVCCPSRAQLFTGMPLLKIPNVIKGWWNDYSPLYEADDPDPARVPMLGELLRRGGYYCFGTGKWHNFHATFTRNFNDGAAIYFCGANQILRALQNKPDLSKGQYVTERPESIQRGGHWNQTLHDYDPTGEYSPFGQYIEPRHSTDAYAEAACRFLDEYDGDEPFFLYCAFTAPHGPMQTTSEWHAQYPWESVSLPPNYVPSHPWDNGGPLTKERLESGFSMSEQECRQNIADLYAITAHEDEGIGRIHEALERNGYLDNTIVIHTSDHGKSLGHHGTQGKWSLYEHSIAVPLLMAGPGIPKGEKRNDLVYMHDIFPTVLEACGVEIPESTVYESLWPLFEGQEGREYIGTMLHNNQRMVRDEQYKLISYNVEGRKTVQLFDLKEDPHETCNLAGDPAYRETIANLLERQRDWGEIFADRFDVAPDSAESAVAADDLY